MKTPKPQEQTFRFVPITEVKMIEIDEDKHYHVQYVGYGGLSYVYGQAIKMSQVFDQAVKIESILLPIPAESKQVLKEGEIELKDRWLFEWHNKYIGGVEHIKNNAIHIFNWFKPYLFSISQKNEEISDFSYTSLLAKYQYQKPKDFGDYQERTYPVSSVLDMFSEIKKHYASTQESNTIVSKKDDKVEIKKCNCKFLYNVMNNVCQKCGGLWKTTPPSVETKEEDNTMGKE